MTKPNQPEELIIVCSCSYLGHAIGFTFFPTDPHDKGAFEAYVQVSLERHESFWKRLRIALRYLMKKTCGYGDVSEFIVKDHDLPKIKAWLDKAEVDAAVREAHRKSVLSS